MMKQLLRKTAKDMGRKIGKDLRDMFNEIFMIKQKNLYSQLIKREIIMKEYKNVSRDLAEMIGKKCCRQRVGEWHSLSLGFGQKVYHSKKTVDSFYGEWEVGTYSSAWRIIRSGEVLCGSKDNVNSLTELDNNLQDVLLGVIQSIELLSRFDIRINLDNEVNIDFMQISVEEDEIIHFFGPNNLFVEYRVSTGWKSGKSNEPWV